MTGAAALLYLLEPAKVSDVPTKPAIQKINKEKQVNQSVYFVKNPKEMDKIIEKAKANKIDWNNISLEKNTKAFDESITSVSSIKGIIRIMTYSIILRRYCNTFNDINIMDKRKNT